MKKIIINIIFIFVLLPFWAFSQNQDSTLISGLRELGMRSANDYEAVNQSGLPVTQKELLELDTKAALIKALVPPQYAANFKVFDYTAYPFVSNMGNEGGIDVMTKLMEQRIAALNTTPKIEYYLLLVKWIDSETKKVSFKAKLKLPISGSKSANGPRSNYSGAWDKLDASKIARMEQAAETAMNVEKQKLSLEFEGETPKIEGMETLLSESELIASGLDGGELSFVDDPNSSIKGQGLTPNYDVIYRHPVHPDAGYMYVNVVASDFVTTLFKEYKLETIFDYIDTYGKKHEHLEWKQTNALFVWIPNDKGYFEAEYTNNQWVKKSKARQVIVATKNDVDKLIVSKPFSDCYYHYREINWGLQMLSKDATQRKAWVEQKTTGVLNWNISLYFKPSKACQDDFESENSKNCNPDFQLELTFYANNPSSNNFEFAKHINYVCLLPISNLGYNQIVANIERLLAPGITIAPGIILPYSNVGDTKERAILRLMKAMDSAKYPDFINKLKENNNSLLLQLMSSMDDVGLPGDNASYTELVKTIVLMFNSNQTLKTDLVNKVSGGESPEENIMQVYNFKGYDPLAEASITNDPYTEYAYIWDDSKGTLEVKTLHIGDNSAGYADVLNTKTFQALDPILIDIKDHIAPIQTIMSDLKQNESCKCFIAPAFMLKFRDDKIRNDKIEKAIYITLDAVTIFASGGTALALNTLHKVSTARRAWAAFEVAGALGNIAVNAKDVGPETVLGKFVTAYNNIALVVGAKNVRAGVSKFLKESSPELGISIASDKALQLSFDEFKNLEREYKALNSKPALWQNISPADQAKFAKSVSVIDRLFANVKSAIPEIKNYFTSKLLGVVEDNVTKALKISDDGTEIAQLSNSKLSITKESHFEMVDDLDINTQVDGQELKNLTSVEIDQVQYAVSEAKVKVVTKNGKKTIQCAGNGTYCFAQDTPLPDGTLMSEKQEGDFITAYDTEKKTTTQAKISKIRRSFTSAFTRLWIAGTMLSVTPAHALQTEAGEWVAAGQLKVGESLRSASGVVRLDSTFTESVSPTAVISYELEGGLDYLVGEMPVLVGGTCDLKTIKEALGTEFTIFQNRIISIGLNTTQRATLYKEFLAGNQQLRNLLKTEEGLKAWKGLANTTVRTNIAWLTRTKTWLSEGATLTHSSGRTVLQKAGVEIAEIKNGQLLPFNFSKYENRFPISGATPVGDVTDGYQVVRNGNNWGVRRVPDETPYSTVSHPDGVTTELSELKPNPDAHTLDRHGPDICDEALIERSRSGIAPDGSTIGMASAPPFSLPPSSSKFGSHADVKKALQNTRPGTPAFNATTPKPNGDKIVYHTLTDGTSYGKGVPRGSTSFIQSNMVRAVYKKVGTGPNDYQLVTMFPDF